MITYLFSSIVVFITANLIFSLIRQRALKDTRMDTIFIIGACSFCPFSGILLLSLYIMAIFAVMAYLSSIPKYNKLFEKTVEQWYRNE